MKQSLFESRHQPDWDAFNSQLEALERGDRVEVAFDTGGARRAEAESWLVRVGLAGMGARFPHELSGGQQKFVAFARALMVGTKLLMLDALGIALASSQHDFAHSH